MSVHDSINTVRDIKVNLSLTSRAGKSEPLSTCLNSILHRLQLIEARQKNFEKATGVRLNNIEQRLNSIEDSLDGKLDIFPLTCDKDVAMKRKQGEENAAR